MPNTQEILFTNQFDPEKDTPVLNSILEELYHRIKGWPPGHR